MSRALVQVLVDLAGLAGGEVVVARDPAALARLQRRRRLPPIYAEFLRAHSSHDFVDAGLVCGETPVWLTPVDALEEIAGCYAGLPGHWQVCAVEPGGCYVIDVREDHADASRVLHVDEVGAHREVARDFLEFLRRIVRDTAARRARPDMSERTAAQAAAPGAGWPAGAWAAAAAVVLVVAAAALGLLR